MQCTVIQSSVSSKNFIYGMPKHIKVKFFLQKTVRDKNYKALQGKLDRLEKLCRALQRERNDLNQKLKTVQVSTKDVEEEGTGPPDPQPEDHPNQPLNTEMEREVEGEMEALVPETEKLRLQSEVEGTTPSTQLIDD